MAGNFTVTAFLCLTNAVGLFFAAFYIFNFIRRKRMRTIVSAPSCILYLHLAIIDVIGTLLWTLYTAFSASAGKWPLPDALCEQQVYIRVFCNMANVVTLMIFIGERFVRIFKPSKHREIFFDVVVLFMILGVYIYAGVLASFPIWGWGRVRYFEKEYQCAIAFEYSPSYYDFSIAMSVGIPGGLILVGYVAILVRVFLLKRKSGSKGVVVLEENFDTNEDSYTDRLHRMYETFRDPTKKFKPKTDDTVPLDDTSYIDSDTFNSDDEEAGADKKDERLTDYVDDEATTTTKSRKMPPKKCYYLGKNDLGLTHMSAILALVYVVLWIPYYVRFYQDTYQFYETTPSDGFILAAVCLTHLGGVYKIPFYLFSHTVRGAFKKTLGIGQNEKKKRKARRQVTEQNA